MATVRYQTIRWYLLENFKVGRTTWAPMKADGEGSDHEIVSVFLVQRRQQIAEVGADLYRSLRSSANTFDV